MPRYNWHNYNFCSGGFVIRPQRIPAFSMRENNKQQINTIPKCGALFMWRITNPHIHGCWITNPAEQRNGAGKFCSGGFAIRPQQVLLCYTKRNHLSARYSD
ncbi:MAG: hypothetical protein K5860_03610 [Bacteroidales bacterium]|nr:hypothetical protein [Bacteroidales bacterium]